MDSSDPLDDFARKIAEAQAKTQPAQRAVSWKGDINPSLLLTIAAQVVASIFAFATMREKLEGLSVAVHDVQVRVEKMTEQRVDVVRLEERFGSLLTRLDAIAAKVEDRTPPESPRHQRRK